MERTNETWLAELQSSGSLQTEALADLRQFLQRGVLAYLHSRSDLDLAEIELRQMSEDLTQEAILKIQANLDSFQGKSKFTTWAAKIAANHTISELRRAKWRDLSLDTVTEAGTSLEESLGRAIQPGGNPDTQNERQQVWQSVIEVINRDLTDRQRQVLAAIQMEGLPVEEVARLLETNPNNIYKLLHDARLKLKQHLTKLGLEPSYILRLFSED